MSLRFALFLEMLITAPETARTRRARTAERCKLFVAKEVREVDGSPLCQLKRLFKYTLTDTKTPQIKA